MQKTAGDVQRLLRNLYGDAVDSGFVHGTDELLLGGARKPTVEEMVEISEAYDVSLNYLLTGDELFPSIHRIPMKDQKRLLEEIEDLSRR